MVSVAETKFDVSGATLLLLSVFSAISPYDCSKSDFKTQTFLLSRDVSDHCPQGLICGVLRKSLRIQQELLGDFR